MLKEVKGLTRTVGGGVGWASSVMGRVGRSGKPAGWGVGYWGNVLRMRGGK